MINTIRRVDRPALESGGPRHVVERRGPWVLVAPLIVLAVALLPRLWAPAAFLTWDEATWAYRSLGFLRALETGRLADTWQSDHPGVVTMWAGAAGIALGGPVQDAPFLPLGSDAGAIDEDAADVDNRVGSAGADAPWQRYMQGSLGFVDDLPPFDEDDIPLVRQVLPYLPAARVAVALLGALLIALATGFLGRLLSPWAALLGGLMLALDPWLLAHSRVLHLDALLSLLMLCSVLATLVGTLTARPLWLVLGGLLGGLAVLEKSPGLFVVGFALLLIALVGLAQEGVDRRALRRVSGRLVAWLVAAAAAYAIAWPALWVAPVETLGKMAGYAVESAGRPRDAMFFLGSVRPDPGISFYLLVLAHRLAPLTLIGVAVAMLSLPGQLRLGRLVAPVMLAFALLFTVAMGQSAKKFDRYVLPAAIVLNVAAAIGLYGAVGYVDRRWHGGNRMDAGLADDGAAKVRGGARLAQRRMWASPSTLVLGVLFGLQSAHVLAAHPYYLSWASPLLGDTPAAARRLPIGWGEGTEQAVAWLNALPEAEHVRVATPSMGLIGPGFSGVVMKMGKWWEARYVLLYIDDVQTGEPQQVLEVRTALEQVHVIEVRGVEAVWIYEVPSDWRP